MATLLPSSFPSSLRLSPQLRRLSFPSIFLSSPTTSRNFHKPLPLRLRLRASLFDSHSDKKSRLSRLIQEIEPLDVSLIQKDVPAATVEAMKRTISGMLGLLPSDHFQVLIDALWEPLSKLLVSSMTTGYTLRNAEYRLCLEKSLDAYEENVENQMVESSGFDVHGMLIENTNAITLSAKDTLSSDSEKTSVGSSEGVENQGLDGMSPEAQEYVRQLQSHLSSVKKELCEVNRKSAALQTQQFVGEEKNDLLDYLRSLQPEKVAELSEPTSPELKETIHSVVHGLLATLSPKMHSTAPPMSENSPIETASSGSGDCSEIAENTSLQFQPLISLTRDYLARLLFWCMLLGHYLKGLEYRMELIELLSLTKDDQNQSDASDGKQAA